MKSLFTLFTTLLIATLVVAQTSTEPVVTIDTNRIVFKPGLSFPYWLNAGQTVKFEKNIKTISALEFNLDTAGNLKLIKPITLSSAEVQIVPEGKVWKLEGMGIKEPYDFTKIGMINQTTRDFSTDAKPSIFKSPATFDVRGNYTWKVPPDVFRVCVEVWGSGGSGGDIIINGHTNPGLNTAVYSAGGGGGAYSYQCYEVSPGSEINIKIGGSDESTLFGNYLEVLPGHKGENGSMSATEINLGESGNGGSSNAFYNIQGFRSNSTKGGDAANGGGKGGENPIYWQFQQYFSYRYIDPRPGSNFGGGGSGIFGYIDNYDPSYGTISLKGPIGGIAKMILYW